MSRRRRGDFPKRPPRRQAVGGIKTKSRSGVIGESWWSQRFVDVLNSFHMGSRLSRGRSYARSGQVLDLEIEAGRVQARVQGSRRKPYEVTIRVRPLKPEDWDRVEAAMAEQAIFLAKLLAGEMPQNIEEAFRACGVTLFPAATQEMFTACTCPDWVNPCKHVAATYYILAERFDEDPFLIFTWRGRSKDDLLEHLRALRGAAGPEDGDDEAAPEVLPEPQPVSLPHGTDAAAFFRSGVDLSTPRADLHAPEMPDTLLRLVGRSPTFLHRVNLAELLAPAYSVMSREAARRMLQEEASAEDD